MIVLLTVPGTPPIVAYLKEEDENYLTVEYPFIFMKEDHYIYTLPYMPFGNNNAVIFNKNTIIATSNVHKEIEKHYKLVVKEFRKQKLSFRDPSSEEEKKPKIEIPDFKSKTLH